MRTNTVADAIASITFPCPDVAQTERQLKRAFDKPFMLLLCHTLQHESGQILTWTGSMQKCSADQKKRLIQAINQRYALNLEASVIDLLITPRDLSTTVFQQVRQRRG